MAHSLIGFDKKQWKSVKFDRTVHTDEVLENIKYVKFAYGASEDPANQKPIIGKILKIHEKGLELTTDYGFMFPMWHRITRVFEYKGSARMKNTNVKAARTNAFSIAGLLDGALDKIIAKIKTKYPELKVQDNKVDLSTRYNREVKFFIGHRNLYLTVRDANAKAIEITGTSYGKAKMLAPDKKGKIAPQKIFYITKKIGSLLDK